MIRASRAFDMEQTVEPGKLFRFGLFEAEPACSTLTRNGVRVKIQEQPFRVLVLLLERPGEIVTREELRQKLWPEGTYVDFDGSLNVILKKLRAAIDDDSDNPRFIETVPRRGYRFIAPVETIEPQIVARSVSSASAENHERPRLATLQRGNTVPVQERRNTDRRKWFILAACVLILAVTGIAVIRLATKTIPAASPEYTPKTSLAVIPFSNGDAGPSFDYLRFALPSDVVTDLSYARSISVRPFASTTKYAEGSPDPQAVGRAMNVSYVISGDFVNENGNLKVTAELTRVSDDRVLWRDNVSAPISEMVRLHEDLAQRLQDGVVARVGGPPITNEIPVPHHPRAYDMYLRAVAMPRDPTPNHTAIALLKEAISEDPDYAPAWSELSWRYYLDAEYSNGGEASYRLSDEATARATALDPNGTTNAIAQKADHGELEAAYDEARALLSRRPDSSDAHFEMSYVYRYAGLLDKAAQECDAALTIDPGNFLFRSCSKVFLYKGNKARAQTFFDLDGNSGWSVRQEMQLALRQKDNAFALALAIIALESGYKDVEIVVAQLEHKSSSEITKIGAREESDVMGQTDPEEKYETAAMLSFSGQDDAAMKVLKSAIDTGYCATPLLESDPLLSNLRSRTEFQKMKLQAEQCQQKFLAHTTTQDFGGQVPAN
ncbi:MAG TPA: winged helix-turn-helix domain-containing protein [Terriglobales bacterium]|nr:winged helix-turn-helix domain-containing protein [Terriglobales bacterium]